jgi:hypothetical protein
MSKIAQLLAIISNFIFEKFEIKHLTKAYFERVRGFICKNSNKKPAKFCHVYFVQCAMCAGYALFLNNISFIIYRGRLGIMLGPLPIF